MNQYRILVDGDFVDFLWAFTDEQAYREAYRRFGAYGYIEVHLKYES